MGSENKLKYNWSKLEKVGEEYKNLFEDKEKLKQYLDEQPFVYNKSPNTSSPIEESVDNDPNKINIFIEKKKSDEQARLKKIKNILRKESFKNEGK